MAQDHQPGEIGDGLRRQRAATRCRSPTWQFARIDAGDATPAPKPLLGLDSAYWFKIIEAAIMCVTALLIGLFVARPLISRMFAPNAAGAARLPARQRLAGRRRAARARQRSRRAGDGRRPASACLAGAQPGIDISRIEGQVRESSIKKIGEVVDAHPEEALAIIRTWLHQPV